MKKGIIALALISYLDIHELLASEVPAGVKPDSAKIAPTARLVDEIKTATPIKRVTPKYPKTAARNGHEGWVNISFVVDKDGKVVDPVITDSSGHHSFRSAAISSVKQWDFEPASRNGKAIESCQNEVQLSFSISNQKLSRKFHQFYNSTRKLLAEGKLDAVKEELTQTRFKTESNLLEQSYLSMLWSDYYQKTNQPKEQLKHLYKVTGGVKTLYKEETFSADIHLFNLQQRFVAEINTQQFASALDTFEGISNFETPQAKTLVESFEPYVKQIESLKTAETKIVYDGAVSNKGRWHHRLYKNGFALAEVQGELTKLDIRCNGHRVTYVPQENNHWKIPDTWGSCYLFIEGDEGATFKLVESNKA